MGTHTVRISNDDAVDPTANHVPGTEPAPAPSHRLGTLNRRRLRYGASSSSEDPIPVPEILRRHDSLPHRSTDNDMHRRQLFGSRPTTQLPGQLAHPFQLNSTLQRINTLHPGQRNLASGSGSLGGGVALQRGTSRARAGRRERRAAQ